MLMSYVATANCLSCRFSLGNSVWGGLSAWIGGNGDNAGNIVRLHGEQGAIAGAKPSLNRLHRLSVLVLGGLIPTIATNRPSWISDRQIADWIDEPVQRLSGTFRDTPGRT